MNFHYIQVIKVKDWVCYFIEGSFDCGFIIISWDFID